MRFRISVLVGRRGLGNLLLIVAPVTMTENGEPCSNGYATLPGTVSIPEPVMSQARHAATFRHLHDDGLLLLANAWDAGSARLIENLGAAAIATTSAGLAWPGRMATAMAAICRYGTWSTRSRASPV